MPSTLLIGFGSVLRGDDGIGMRIAERLEEDDLGAGVRVVAAHQLLPEHVEWLREVERVIFVDAAVDVPAGELVVSVIRMRNSIGTNFLDWKFVPIEFFEAEEPGPLTFHHLTPRGLLAACASLYGRAPAAALVRIGVGSTETSMALSADLERRFEEYCERVRDLVRV